MARKPKLDTVLADAVDTARAALTEIASASEVGDYQGVAVEGERLVTHRFIAHRDGYRGWNWFVTLARVPRAKAKDATVCEIGIIPGEEALLAPAWVPWADRLAQEEVEAAEAAAREEAEGAHAADGEAAPDPEHEERAKNDTGQDGTEDGEVSGAEEVSTDDEPATEEPAAAQERGRRPVPRRRTAQRTAARRRAAQRNRSRRSS